jgi:hypothetical protein
MTLTQALHRLGTASTALDALVAFVRDDSRIGAVLLGAAALSVRVPGVGVAASVLVRLYRRLR